MATRVIFAPAAIQDLNDILEFIAQDSPADAFKWVGKIEARCKSLAKFPHKGQSRDDVMAGVRSLTIGAYLVFYRTSSDLVEVMAVIHSSRDPEKIADIIRQS